jgi:V/A-type H+-transporting ATPase subunit E
MAEELQGLLERIQKDGIEKADTESAKIVGAAKAKAAEIISSAKKEAEGILAKAEADGQIFEARGKSAISQAARDVILSVGDTITATLEGIVSKHVDNALSKDDFPAIVKSAVMTYCENSSAENIEVITGEDQREKVTAFFMSEMADQMKNGLSIKGDRNIVSGFIVSLKADGVHHDFTGETLTNAIGTLLRPELAEIVKNATEKSK